MSKVNRYEYEGKVIEIPLRWDEHSKKSRITVYLYPHAVMVDDDPASIDCGSCIYFRQPAESILGVCHNKKMRSGIEPQEKSSGAKEETL